MDKKIDPGRLFVEDYTNSTYRCFSTLPGSRQMPKPKLFPESFLPYHLTSFIC